MGTIFKLYGLRTHIESWGGTPITRFSWYQQKYLWKIKKKKLRLFLALKSLMGHKLLGN